MAIVQLPDPDKDHPDSSTEREYSPAPSCRALPAKEDTEFFPASDNEECGDSTETLHLIPSEKRLIRHAATGIDVTDENFLFTYCPAFDWLTFHPHFENFPKQFNLLTILRSKCAFQNGLIYASNEYIASLTDGRFSPRQTMRHITGLVDVSLVFRHRYRHRGTRRRLLILPDPSFGLAVSYLERGLADANHIPLAEQKIAAAAAKKWNRQNVEDGVYEGKSIPTRKSRTRS